MHHLRHRIDGDLSIITLVNPPQNRITSEMSDELGEAVAETAASGDRTVHRRPRRRPAATGL